ncbi:MAG: Ku protein, partial [Gemmatimonadetes bacterium]|nr:Ku protein [Gemmatimonadota bacterium]
EEPGARPQVIDLMEILKQRMAEAQEDSGEEPAGGARKSGGKASRSKATGTRAPARKGGGGDPAGASKAELYERAKKLDIPGRSQMSRDELAAAIRRSA